MKALEKQAKQASENGEYSRSAQLSACEWMAILAGMDGAQRMRKIVAEKKKELAEAERLMEQQGDIQAAAWKEVADAHGLNVDFPPGSYTWHQENREIRLKADGQP